MKREKLGEGKCVLYDRDCIGCGECEFCDLDPLKICDNCGKCLEIEDCASIKIDAVYGGYEPDDCDCGCDHDHGDCDCGCDHDHDHGDCDCGCRSGDKKIKH